MNKTRMELIELTAIYADWALESIPRQYPNHVSLSLRGAKDLAEPRHNTPIFYGCYDWHSSVHSHWMLVRLARLYPEAPYVDRALALLSSNFVPTNYVGEFKYLSAGHRQTFERPYGLAWLLQLGAELRQWPAEYAQAWAVGIEPLEQLAADRLAKWLEKLTHPIRSGEHSQTAFAMGLALDWSRIAKETGFETFLVERAHDYYRLDRDAPLWWEPSGHDFLSPCLAEADLMRRCMDRHDFGQWLAQFMPFLPITDEETWVTPVRVSDPADPKLAHLDGLNLSRAWMLEGVASKLASDDPRVSSVQAASIHHREVALASLTDQHYEGTHWLGSFVTYLVTARGID